MNNIYDTRSATVSVDTLQYTNTRTLWGTNTNQLRFGTNYQLESFWLKIRRLKTAPENYGAWDWSRMGPTNGEWSIRFK